MGLWTHRRGQMFLLVFSILISIGCSAWAEDITITTWYPAATVPNQNRVHGNRISVGDDYNPTRIPDAPLPPGLPPGTLIVSNRVGIGTSAPPPEPNNVRLDVRGAAAISGGALSAATNNRLLPGALNIGDIGRDYGGGSGWNPNVAGLLLEALDNTEIAVHDSGSRLASLMYFQGAGVNRITIGRDMGFGGTISTIALNGNVGIGTAAPRTPLSVMANIAGLTTGLELSAHHTPGVAAGGIINANDSDGTTVRPLTLQNNGGNVGIGTTAPPAPLSVRAVERVNNTLRLVSAMGEVRGLTTGVELWAHHTPGVAAGGIINANDSDGTTVRPLTLQNNGGHLGIGTTEVDPSIPLLARAKLRVNGNVRIDGTRLKLNRGSIPDPFWIMAGPLGGNPVELLDNAIGFTTDSGGGRRILIGPEGVPGIRWDVVLNNGILWLEAGYMHLQNIRNLPDVLTIRAGDVRLGTSGGTSNLFVNGNAYKPTGPTWLPPASDIRLKKNVMPIEGALEKVLALRGITFEWKDTEKYKQWLLPGTHMGMTTQDVEKVFPEWVVPGAIDGYKTINISGFEALTVEAFRQLKSENDHLADENKSLKSEVDFLKKRLSAVEEKLAP